MEPRRLLIVEAHVLAVLVRVAVRLVALRRVAGALARIPRARHAVDPTDACIEAARRAAARAAHATCFFESLVAFGLLARRGRRVELHLGARRAPGLESHAWVTVDGAPCGPQPDAEYTPLWCVRPAVPR